MHEQSEQEIVRVDLTASQKEQIKAKTGRDAETIELTVQELEERIAPRITRNHDETFLILP